MNVVTIEFAYPTWIRGVARLALPVLAVATAGAALAVPKAFMSGETLTAADLNARFEAVEASAAALDSRTAALESSAVMMTEWQAYAPTVRDAGSGAALGIQADGVWRRVGDSIEVRVKLTNPAGSTGGNYIAVGIPDVGANIDSAKLGSLSFAGAASRYQATPNTSTLCGVDVGSALSSVLVWCEGGSYVSPGSLATPNDQIVLRLTVPVEGWTASSP
jgi:hypothetical protein